MSGYRFLTLLIVFVLSGAAAPAQSTGIDFADCRTCHEGIERLDANHAFACDQCHLLPVNRGRRLQTHQDIIRHPAALEHAAIFCASCHEREIYAFKNSLHYTLAGIINQTRYLWGAQKNPNARYAAAAHDTLKRLPPSPSVVHTPADLADDLLRRKCFHCHTERTPPPRDGFFRGTGCAACHILYENDGIYRGKDRTMTGRRGYPKYHRFCKPIPVRQCRHCHNGSRVGADYTGLYEHDYHQSYRTPIKDGTLPERTYLMDHHFLRPDVHCERGLACVDCHRQSDVMGTGALMDHQQTAVQVRCVHCHGSLESDSKTTVPEGMGKRVFRSKKQAGFFPPRYDQSVAAHAIPQMKNIHCVGCHSAWGFTDYGPDILRDDRKDLSQWAPWRRQGDGAVADLFDEQGRFLGIASNKGPWFIGWRFRRWEFLTLGIDVEGRVVPFRPRYQYQISYVTQDGDVLLDSVIPERGDKSGPGWAFMPFYPHTVVRRAKPCEACHGQALAAGLGLWNGKGSDLQLTVPSPPVYAPLRLLSEKERQTLMQKTPSYRQWRFETLYRDFYDRSSVPVGR